MMTYETKAQADLHKKFFPDPTFWQRIRTQINHFRQVVKMVFTPKIRYYRIVGETWSGRKFVETNKGIVKKPAGWSYFSPWYKKLIWFWA